MHALVLDEADEMLDLGFLPDVEKLLSKTPETRQTMLFSATMPSAIVALARRHMRHPMNIRAESSYDTTMVPATAQFIYLAHDLDKPEMIGRILQAEDAGKMIVFTRTKRQAQRIADDLEERGFKSSALHGDMAQVAREKALTRFREDKLQVLVATDVAARGIDVAGVTHVINYTCPEDDKAYVHRIGRTGRAGASGIAITFVDWADLHRWKMINKTLDLPFDEPQETYSTSEHLFHDQGIPPGTKGRIVPEKPREPREPQRAARWPWRARRPDGDRRERGDRPQRDRNRTRSRSGEERRGRACSGRATASAGAGEPAERRCAAHPQPSPPSSFRLRRGQGPRDRLSDLSRSLTISGVATAEIVRVPRVPGETCAPGSGGDVDLGADRGELPQRDGVVALLTDAAVRLRRAELVDGLHELAVVDRDVVEADGRAVGALGEADEVLHRPGVVDPPRLLGPRVDRVGAGVEVVVEAARDQVGPLDVLVVVDQPDPLVALVEDDPPAVAGVVGDRRVRVARCHDRGVVLGPVARGRDRGLVLALAAVGAACVGRRRSLDGSADGVVAAPARTEPAAAVESCAVSPSSPPSPLATDGSTPTPPSIAMPVTLSEAPSTASRP